MARKCACGQRRGEKDTDHRGSLEIRKSEQLFQCKQVRIKQLTGHQSRQVTLGVGLPHVSVKTYGESNRAGLRYE